MNDASPAGPPLSGIHIMLVEDDDTIRELLADLLVFEGAEVTTASSGNEARALLAAVRPQLIISDVMMPDGDGHELLRRLQTDSMLHGVPFIFLTARSEPADQRLGMNLGADDYLVKPVSRQDLLDAVHARLRRSRVAGFCQRELDAQLRDEYARRVPAQLITPLHTIRGAAEIQLLDADLGAENRELAEMIIAASERMARTVKRFWRLTELQATLRRAAAGEPTQPVRGGGTPKARLAETAEAIAAEAGRAADFSATLLSVPFPMGEDDLLLLSRELLDNAFRFSPAGSPVHLVTRLEEGCWSLSVVDQGRDLAPADVGAMERWLRGFQDASSREPRGMGLAIVDSVARTHGFKVDFAPAQPSGLQVTVSKLVP